MRARSLRLPALLPLALSMLAAVALGGCGAESALVTGDRFENAAQDDSDTGEALDEDGLQVIRLDIYPSSSGPTLEPQSVVVGLGTETTNLELELREPITVRGEVSGYLATPPSGIEVPGETVPVVAEVYLTQSNSIAGDSTTSDTQGDFDLLVTPGADYVFSIIPVDPSNLPFLVISDLNLDSSQRLTGDMVALGNGVPVYGTVTHADGVPVRTSVALVDSVTGVQGGAVDVDATGYFLLRAMPGRYDLVVQGDTSRAVPSVSVDVTVAEEDGARVDVDMGDYQAVTFDCNVLDEDGEAVANVPVRFESVSLENPEWSLTVESETDSSGVVFTRLLPGSWTAEFIPSADSGLSPAALSLTVTDEIELADPVVLPPLTSLTGRVVDPQGYPLSGVLVSAREQAFEGRSWSGSTDADGNFEFDVPAVRLELTFTPASSEVAITRLEHDPIAEQIGDVVLPYGMEVSGVLRTSDGALVPYAVVELHNAATGDLLGTTLSNGSGEFSARVNP